MASEQVLLSAYISVTETALYSITLLLPSPHTLSKFSLAVFVADNKLLKLSTIIVEGTSVPALGAYPA